MRLVFGPCYASGIGLVSSRKPNAAGGFTLVETMVAGGILLFVVASLLGAYFFGFGQIRFCQESERADQVLLEKMELLRVYDWSKITSTYFPQTFTTNFWNMNGTPAGIVYTGTVTIAQAPLSESYASTLRQVTVTLNWNSGKTPQSRSISTLVSQNGIATLKH